MSWSIVAVGKPSAALKAELSKQFEVAKQSTLNIPAEQKSVAAVEQLVNLQIDFAAVNRVSILQVSASGHACLSSKDWPGALSIKVDVNPIYGFVEDVEGTQPDQPEPKVSDAA